VLDVAAGNELFEAGSQHRASGVTLLNDHVTGIVDLGAVPPLPLSSNSEQAAYTDWNQNTEAVSETLA